MAPLVKIAMSEGVSVRLLAKRASRAHKALPQRDSKAYAIRQMGYRKITVWLHLYCVDSNCILF
jgi:hypothetical protein